MIRRLTLAAALALALPVLAPAPAEAQSNACRNRVFVNTVYQTGVGANNFEYFVQIRNGTATPLSWQLSFASFGSTVTLFSPQLNGGPLPPFATETIRFGRGTNGQINTGTVSVVYDAPAGGGRPTVALANCR